MSLCYCGSEKDFGSCCQRFLENKEISSDAQELMRSRYSAYVTKNAEYLNATSTVNIAQVEFNAMDTLVWLGLKVEKFTEDEVTFTAYYKDGNVLHVIREHSFFVKEWGRLKYDAGEMLDAKIERNETCPCGSGKKYKKCCGK